ncbi:MAG: thioredoxin, partial [Lacipirellulaceae bacterium]
MKIKGLAPVFAGYVRLSGLIALSVLTVSIGQKSHAAKPSVADALKLKPVQRQVEFDTPEADGCEIKAEKINGMTAWVVRSPGGSVLRQFSDTNGDNVVDTWSYFHNGLEVYRDIDGDYNGKADQYRWFQTAGSRWGKDKNEDGRIDSWQLIAPEEVAEEAIEAVRTSDSARMARLLVTEEDMKQLGLSKEVAGRIRERASKAPTAFKSLAKSKKIPSNSEFSDFGGLRPGMVPAGSSGLEKDLLVYENVWAMVYDGKAHKQVQLGTMLKVGDAWKLIDAPSIGEAGEMAVGFFYDAAGAAPVTMADAGVSPPSDAMQETLSAIEKLDEQLVSASRKDLPRLNARRADLLEKLASQAPAGEEREQWLRQLADMISAAVQDGAYPKGAERLEALAGKLAKAKASKDLQMHIVFRRMQADYGLKIADPKADYNKLHNDWLKQLEAFVSKYSSSEHAAEAMLQLANASEYAGEPKEALKWYGQLAKSFPRSPQAAKAKGAITRLTSEGRKISLAGKTIEGKSVDLSRYRGKPVVIQYWFSSYKSCKAEHAVLKDLYSKY